MLRKILDVVMESILTKVGKSADTVFEVIPRDVWDAMPDKLKETLIKAKKDGGYIWYWANCPGGIFATDHENTYKHIGVSFYDKCSIRTMGYNAETGVMTVNSRNNGPLSGGGMLLDPETGKCIGMYVS